MATEIVYGISRFKLLSDRLRVGPLRRGKDTSKDQAKQKLPIIIVGRESELSIPISNAQEGNLYRLADMHDGRMVIFSPPRHTYDEDPLDTYLDTPS